MRALSICLQSENWELSVSDAKFLLKLIKQEAQYAGNCALKQATFQMFLSVLNARTHLNFYQVLLSQQDSDSMIRLILRQFKDSDGSHRQTIANALSCYIKRISQFILHQPAKETKLSKRLDKWFKWSKSEVKIIKQDRIYARLLDSLGLLRESDLSFLNNPELLSCMILGSYLIPVSHECLDLQIVLGIFETFQTMINTSMDGAFMREKYLNLFAIFASIGTSSKFWPNLNQVTKSTRHHNSFLNTSVPEIETLRYDMCMWIVKETIGKCSLNDCLRADSALNLLFSSFIEPIIKEIEAKIAENDGLGAYLRPCVVRSLIFVIDNVGHLLVDLGSWIPSNDHEKHLDSLLKLFELVVFKSVISHPLQVENKENLTNTNRIHLPLILSITWTIRQYLVVFELSRISPVIRRFLNILSKGIRSNGVMTVNNNKLSDGSNHSPESLYMSAHLIATCLPLLKGREYCGAPDLLDKTMLVGNLYIKSGTLLANSTFNSSKAISFPIEIFQKACYCSSIGWILLGSICSFGSEYINLEGFPDADGKSDFIHSIFECWGIAFSPIVSGKLIVKDEHRNETLIELSLEGWIWNFIQREAAVSCMWKFMQHNSSLISTNSSIHVSPLNSPTTRHSRTVHEMLAVFCKDCLKSLNEIPREITHIIENSCCFNDGLNLLGGHYYDSLGSNYLKNYFELNSTKISSNPFLIPQGSLNLDRIRYKLYNVMGSLNCTYNTSLGFDDTNGGGSFELCRELLNSVTGKIFQNLASTQDLSKILKFYSQDFESDPSAKVVCSSGQSSGKNPKAYLVPISSISGNGINGRLRWFLGSLRLNSKAQGAFWENSWKGSIGKYYDNHILSVSNRGDISQNQRKNSFGLENIIKESSFHGNDHLDFQEGESPIFTDALPISPWNWGTIANDFWDQFVPCYDGTWNCSDEFLSGNKLYQPKPLCPSILLTDVSVEYLGFLFNTLDSTYQEIILDQVVKTIELYGTHYKMVNTSYSSVNNNVGDVLDLIILKKTKAQVNAVTMLIIAFQQPKKQPLNPTSPKDLRRIWELVKIICIDSLASTHSSLRMLAARCLALFAKNVYQSHEMRDHLFNKIVNAAVKSSFSASLRSGACLAISTIAEILKVAPSKLEYAVQILKTLSLDPNILVSASALRSLSLLLESYGNYLIISPKSSATAEEMIDLCLKVLHSTSVVPFWGAHKKKVRSCQNQYFVSTEPPGFFICPYKSVMRIVQAIINIYGPELSSLNSSLRENLYKVLESVRKTLVLETIGFQSRDFPKSQENSSGFLSKILEIEPLPVTYSMSGIHLTEYLLLTTVSPLYYISVELMICLDKFVTFNVFSVLPDPNLILMKARFFALPVSDSIIPQPLRQLSISMLWKALMIRWPCFDKDVDIFEITGDDLVPIVIYLLDNQHVAGAVLNKCYKTPDLNVSSSIELISPHAQKHSQKLREIFSFALSHYKNNGSSFQLLDLLKKIFNRNVIVPGISRSDFRESVAVPEEDDDEASDEDFVEEDYDLDDYNDDQGQEIPDGELSQPPGIVDFEAMDSIPNSLQMEPTSVDEYLKRIASIQLDETTKISWRTQYFLTLSFKSFMEYFSQLDVENPPSKTITEIFLPKIGDLIQLAYNIYSSSEVEAVKVASLRLLGSLVKAYGTFRDPDFPEIPLLEQFEAQIVSCISVVFENKYLNTANSLNVSKSQNLSLDLMVDYLSSFPLNPPSRLINLLSNMVLKQTSYFFDPDYDIFKNIPTYSILKRVKIVACWSKIVYNLSFIEDNLISDFFKQRLEEVLPQLLQEWFFVLRFYVKNKYLFMASDVDVEEALKAKSDIGIGESIEPGFRSIWEEIIMSGLEFDIPCIFKTIGICLEHRFSTVKEAFFKIDNSMIYGYLDVALDMLNFGEGESTFSTFDGICGLKAIVQHLPDNIKEEWDEFEVFDEIFTRISNIMDQFPDLATSTVILKLFEVVLNRHNQLISFVKLRDDAPAKKTYKRLISIYEIIFIVISAKTPDSRDSELYQQALSLLLTINEILLRENDLQLSLNYFGLNVKLGCDICVSLATHIDDSQAYSGLLRYLKKLLLISPDTSLDTYDIECIQIARTKVCLSSMLDITTRSASDCPDLEPRFCRNRLSLLSLLIMSDLLNLKSLNLEQSRSISKVISADLFCLLSKFSESDINLTTAKSVFKMITKYIIRDFSLTNIASETKDSSPSSLILNEVFFDLFSKTTSEILLADIDSTQYIAFLDITATVVLAMNNSLKSSYTEIAEGKVQWLMDLILRLTAFIILEKTDSNSAIQQYTGNLLLQLLSANNKLFKNSISYLRNEWSSCLETSLRFRMAG